MSLLSAKSANLSMRLMKMFLTSTLDSNYVVHTFNNSSKVFKWYSSGKAWITQSTK